MRTETKILELQWSKISGTVVQDMKCEKGERGDSQIGTCVLSVKLICVMCESE